MTLHATRDDITRDSIGFAHRVRIPHFVRNDIEAWLVSMNSPETFRQTLERVRAELETEVPAGERVRLRDEIVGLFREIESAIAELEELKEGVRPLVGKYKERFAKPAAPRHVDHLGASTYRERGWSALAGADYEKAVVELEKAVELDPETPANRVLLAWSYLRQQEWAKGGSLLRDVLAVEPAHPLGRVCMGYLRLREARFGEAIENLAAVVREGTDRTATLYANLYLGMVYAERDMHRDAQRFLLKALELAPNLTEAYWELGRSHQRDGRDDLALEAWNTGGANRFSPWGERCRQAAERLASRRGAGLETP
jgi:tetratricopeptide (TPR) repeat protein